MRKVILSISILLGLSLVSCDKSEVTQGTSSNSGDNLAQKQSTIISGVESISIDNGLGNTGCTNNILIFPTWNSYWATIDQLDQLTENYCNNFDATVPAGTTDDQYDVLAANVSFDEDNMLSKFENDLEFCSLRRKLISAEDLWLSNQSLTGTWDPNSDPDNDFIDDDTERALLSYGHEVIIGDKRTGYTIYKFIDDLGNYITIQNMDLVALQQINHGTIPTNNPNVTVSTPPKAEGSASCKQQVKEVTYEEAGGNKIKRISKIRTAIGTNCPTNGNPCTSLFPSKVKAKTKGYIYKRGRWRARRSMITAGIDGAVVRNSGQLFTDCGNVRTVLEEKTKRRRKVKVKVLSGTYIAPVGTPARFNNSVQDNLLFSLHQQGGLLINKDFYDMPVN